MAEESGDIRAIVQAVVQEFLPQRAELEEAHKQREALEQRVKELTDENARSRAENEQARAESEKAKMRADEAERSAMVRAELQRQGVAKLDLAYRAIRDEVARSENGRLVARDGADLREYVTQFVAENPELLPARVSGGSGAVAGQRGGPVESGVDLDRIRPGMSAEEMERVRQEIARVASQTLRGL